MRNPDKTFQLNGKQDSCKHKLKISINMYESSDSQLFKTTIFI